MKEFIKEITDNALVFGAQYIFLSPTENGHLLGESLDKGKSIYMRAVSQRPSDLTSKGYLGNLDLLKKLSSMDQIVGNEGWIKPVVGEFDNSPTPLITDLHFSGPRLKAQYKATDPRIATAVVTMPKTYPTDFPVSLSVDTALARELRDAVSIQSTALGKDKEECFVYVGIKDGDIFARFPYHETGATIIIGNAEREIDEVPFASDVLIRVLDTATRAGATALSLTHNASRVVWKTAEVEFMALLPKSVTPNRT